jgi:hypothetical protein
LTVISFLWIVMAPFFFPRIPSFTQGCRAVSGERGIGARIARGDLLPVEPSAMLWH